MRSMDFRNAHVKTGPLIPLLTEIPDQCRIQGYVTVYLRYLSICFFRVHSVDMPFETFLKGTFNWKPRASLRYSDNVYTYILYTCIYISNKQTNLFVANQHSNKTHGSYGIQRLSWTILHLHLKFPEKKHVLLRTHKPDSKPLCLWPPLPCHACLKAQVKSLPRTRNKARTPGFVRCAVWQVGKTCNRRNNESKHANHGNLRYPPPKLPPPINKALLMDY